MVRSVLAVLAGIVVLTVASFALEYALTPFLPNAWVKSVTFAYGFLCVAGGGYVTAWLARRLPLKHAVAMGIAQAGLTILAMFSPEASHASQLQWIITAILSVPAAMAGGFVYSRRIAPAV
jgi:hypothetical protein